SSPLLSASRSFLLSSLSHRRLGRERRGNGGLGTGGGGLPSPTSHPTQHRRARYRRRPPFPDLPWAVATSLPRRRWAR
ncbi:Os12g0492600, partial [Oryza sativa Japonica Group]